MSFTPRSLETTSLQVTETAARMKIILLISLISMALASNYDLKFSEGGRDYVEKIKVDIAGKSEEVSVPKHLDRVAVDILKDFNAKLVARKMIAKKVCYIRSLDQEDSAPEAVDASMRLSKAIFPTSHYTIVQKKYLPLYEMSPSDVSPKIAAHCQGHKMIKIKEYENENVSKWVINAIGKSKSGGKFKRDVTVQTFTACQDQSKNLVETCPFEKLSATCRFARTDGRDCVWQIKCSLGDNGFLCKGRHVFNSPTCCDFVCNN